MYKYIQFDILAVDNLKLGKFDRDSSNWYSHSYIPGSAIKGAIVWSMVQKNGYVNKDILNGNTIFYNAYPLVDEKNAIPMILGYVGDKQDLRSNKDNVRLCHSFDGIKHENTIPCNNYEFVVYDKDRKQLKGYNTKLVENLHINKKDAKDGNKTLMFRYEAVKKGECFRGYIKVYEEFADDIYNILNENVLYFGGSRGSGYGRCKISNIKFIPYIDLFTSDLNIENELYIYFLSDAILYFNGKVYTYLPEEVLKEKLGIEGKCDFISSFIMTDKAATYNNMYHTNTACYTAVSKGSIMKYKVYEKVNLEKIKEFVLNGVGIRKEDGYGQVAVLSKIPDELSMSRYIKKYEIKDNTNNKDIILNQEDEKLINSILKNIYLNRTTLIIEKMVIDLIKSHKKSNDYESAQTQIGKILNLFQNSLYKTEVEFKQELKKYLEHMEGKKGKEAWHKLSKIAFSYTNSNSEKREKYQNKNNNNLDVQTLLQSFVDGKSNIIFDDLNNIAKDSLQLGEYRYPDEVEQDDVYYNLQKKFFINLFEQFLKLKRCIE